MIKYWIYTKVYQVSNYNKYNINGYNKKQKKIYIYAIIKFVNYNKNYYINFAYCLIWQKTKKNKYTKSKFWKKLKNK